MRRAADKVPFQNHAIRFLFRNFFGHLFRFSFILSTALLVRSMSAERALSGVINIGMLLITVTSKY
jgi:hypothetical protein